MEEKKKKVVVAYSGGLDTSYTVMYLAQAAYTSYPFSFARYITVYDVSRPPL